ncbi:MAG TPA: class I SAM-dependent methyltransferase [Gemmatimonadaceae bacterium]
MSPAAARKPKPVVHGTPITNYDNLLDRLSSGERFDYFARNLAAAEERLVAAHVRTVVPSGVVLNVGCGRHGTERSLFPPDRYGIFGVDVSEESLRILHAGGTYEGVLGGSITQLPFPDACADVVYLRLILHHLVAPNYLLHDGLAECFRVLRSGGVLALVEPNSWHPIGAMMNLAHHLKLDMAVHGTDDDVALSPRKLRAELAPYSSRISMHAMTYAWRRMPIGMQAFVGRLQDRGRRLTERVPHFAHTLFVAAVKD